MGCRLPGEARDLESYWDLLVQGRDAIEETPSDRWNLQKFYDPHGVKPGKTQSRWGGYVRDLLEFDPQFFGISPREANSMDPQQRLLLEVTWRALEDGRQKWEELAGKLVSVFVGISSIDYSVASLSFRDRGVIHPYSNTGGSSSIAANRISYCFDFRGPSVAVDTACSSSLVAVHMACESLWSGQAEMALAGGVNAILLPDFYVAFSQLGVLSPDGRCKAFDARANGYVRSEGAGMVVLKPLSKALADNDSIYGLIRATGLNQDGRTPGLTVPSQLAQQELIRFVCRRAGVDPKQVQYVEAHGTGTAVGDPIEANAIGSAIGMHRSQPCFLASVKTNIGHLEAGAGMASLIKMMLALRHRMIPKHLHFENPNPAIDLDRLHLQIPRETIPWPSQAGPRVAGINGFGYGGANAHVLVEEYLPPNAKSSAGHVSIPTQGTSQLSPRCIRFSARTASSLPSVAANLADWLDDHASSSWDTAIDFWDTYQSQFEHRSYVLADDRHQAATRLRDSAGIKSGFPSSLARIETREGSCVCL